VQGQSSQLGEDHPTTWMSKCNLASLLGRMGCHEEATQIQKQALLAFTEQLGASHMTTLRSQGNLAVAVAESGRLAKGCVMLAQAIEASVRDMPFFPSAF